jgi:hypothetical protein
VVKPHVDPDPTVRQESARQSDVKAIEADLSHGQIVMQFVKAFDNLHNYLYPSDMIARNCEQALNTLLRGFPIVTITEPRHLFLYF